MNARHRSREIQKRCQGRLAALPQFVVAGSGGANVSLAVEKIGEALVVCFEFVPAWEPVFCPPGYQHEINPRRRIRRNLDGKEARVAIAVAGHEDGVVVFEVV